LSVLTGLGSHRGAPTVWDVGMPAAGPARRDDLPVLGSVIRLLSPSDR